MKEKTDAEKRQKVKTSRQLSIFHIFACSKVVETGEVASIINIIKKTSEKTIIRDIKELQNAGLINISFSKKENGYIHNDDNNRCPFLSPVFSNSKVKNRIFEKLIRLATIMVELKNHTELPYYDENSKNQKTCVSWYKNKFPNVTTRTMWRDFKELRNIGYDINYDSCERCYTVEFPDGLEGLQSNLQYIYMPRKY